MQRIPENTPQPARAMDRSLAQLPMKMLRAVACHQNGLLQQAQKLYEEILVLQPRNFDALNFMGMIAVQTKNPRRAVALLDRAIEIEPNNAATHCNRGLALQQLKSWDAALASYHRAIEIEADFASAYCYLGNLLQELGQLDRALSSYNQAIAIKADFAEACANRGLVLERLNRLDEALASFNQAIAIKADFAEGYSNRGLVLAKLNRFDDALASLNQAIVINPGYAKAYSNRGLVLADLNRLDEALANHDHALAIKADLAEAHCNRGLVLASLNRLDEALASHDRAIAIKANFAEGHSNRGLVLASLNRLDEALASHDRAIAIKGGFAEGHANRGVVLAELDRLDEALASHDQAIAIKDDFAEGHANRGLVLARLNRLDEAVASYNRAIAIKPDLASANYNRSMTRLLAGDFENGWVDFEWRWKLESKSIASSRRKFSQPLWLGGEPLVGKSILLHSEQGLGDTLQFCRYAKLVADRGARVILQVEETLKTLLAGLDGVAQVAVRGEALPAFDYHCPLMSLPLAFKTGLYNVPSEVPYLECGPEKRLYWAEKLGKKALLRVGLVWSGGYRANQPEVWSVNSRRNIPLAKFAVLKHPEIEFYSLQKGQPAESELSNLNSARWDGPELIDHTSLLLDFSDTAALIEQLDLVISVDTSTAHLAGACGKPVWILNRFDTCWRWLLDREDSPWYPTA
jgi:tetratricopeptide (TPR) repeat protein